jgi:outer membrane lipoprotein-sorting protein
MLRTLTETRLLSAIAVILSILPGSVTAQTAEGVVDRHIEAIGGAGAWKAMTSTRSVGTLTLMGGAAQGDITSTAMRPGMLRADIVVQGMNVVQAFDGESGWLVNPFGGSTAPQPADAATTTAMAEQADIDGPLVGWKEDGHSIELAGTETVNGTEAYRIELTLASGAASTYFLDTATYMVIRVQATRELTGPTTTDLSDYRDVSGLMMPFAVSSTSQAGDQAVSWQTIEVNVDLEESSFVMPGG